PGACSLSPHIALREAGLAFEPVKVDIIRHVFGDGKDFHDVNPSGLVPVLEFDNGERLTEGPAILQYIADLRPDARLAPEAGTMSRYRLHEILNFITSELNKAFGPLFNSNAPKPTRELARAKIGKRFGVLAARLRNAGPYLMGETFTVADGYLFAI